MILPPEGPADHALIQIEEPSVKEFEELGLAIGFELTRSGIRVAVSVGGNPEILPSENFLETEAGLISGSALAQDILRTSPADSLSDQSFDVGLQSMLSDIRRSVTAKAQRLVTAALAAVPPDLDRQSLATIMSAVEGAGMNFLGFVEIPVAAAYGEGLHRRAEGNYRLLAGDVEYSIAVDEGVVTLQNGGPEASAIEVRPFVESAALGAALLAEARNTGQS